MSRNNANRLATQEEETEEESSPSPEIPSTQELSFIVPTEMVDLPSLGVFYPEGNPLRNKDSIEIRYMTTKDEDVLNNKSFIKKGTALDKLLQGLIVDKDIKVNDLLIGDKNALTIAARQTAYGSDYETNITCMTCLSSVKNKFNLADVERKPPAEDIKFTNNGTFILKLPLCQVDVELRLLTGENEVQMRFSEEKKKKHKLPSSPITDFFKSIIVSVNGNNNASLINDFVSSLVTKDSNFIKKEYDRATPNIDLKQAFECSECGTESEVTIPFSVEFFWPDR